jgi:lambda repressor-like predicted transcriptional regulator
MSTRGGNERLRTLLVSLDESPAALAAKVGVDPKTVERWLTTDRCPYPRTAHRVARLLEVDVTYLWPNLYAHRQRPVTSGDELVACYPGRAAVPTGLWSRLLTEARTRITIMGDCALSEVVPNLPALLANQAASGVPVRVILTDPATVTNPIDAVRVQTTDATYRPLLDTPGISISSYPAALTTTIIHTDDDLLIRPSIDGCPMAFAPVLHLRQLPGGPLSTLYLTSVDCVLTESTPVTTRTTLRAVA